jgi:hypothetical protein
MKLAVFCEGTRRITFWLVDTLWIWTLCSLGSVVSLVDESCTTIFYPVSIRRVRPHRHEDYGMIAPQSEVHTPLKASTFAATHFEI